MSWLSIVVFFAIFCGGAFAFGAIEHRFASRPAPRRLRARRVRHNRRCLPSALAPLEFPKWSEKAARLFLEGGSCRWE